MKPSPANVAATTATSACALAIESITVGSFAESAAYSAFSLFEANQPGLAGGSAGPGPGAVLLSFALDDVRQLRPVPGIPTVLRTRPLELIDLRKPGTPADKPSPLLEMLSRRPGAILMER